MNPDDQLFAEALALPAAGRPAFLDRACGTDASLRARIETLLADYLPAEHFLEAPPADRPALPVEEKPGDVIGRYTLLQRLGEGGCGVVYLAEQTEPVRRRVALKIIKLGMDTREVIARFEAERQALALMDHPDIARVFDAGATAAGRPFFVMEYVDGAPITKFCDERDLPMAARLELFVRVCHAVQHAHQKGVIHRDLKPSNILITLQDGAPVPKVIDFGIAKATQGRLTDATLVTAVQQFIGTPAYMSPEQAGLTSLDIDTRSDIYSLGVLLYELLTGRTPFDSRNLLQAGIDELRRRIREEEPPRPSTLLHTLHAAQLANTAGHRQVTPPPKLIRTIEGDLDWIVMRCLEKDRTHRYDTAAALAQDLQRHLRDEPVEARPPDALYRFRKLARRHRFAFGAGTAIAAALVLGLAASFWQALRASRAERIARSEATIAAAVSDFLADDLLRQADSNAQADAREEPNPDLKVREALDRAAAQVGSRFVNQPLVEATVRTAIGRAYLGLGLAAQAEPQFERVRQLRQSALGPEHPATLAAAAALGRAYADQGKYEPAETLQRDVLAAQLRILGPDDPVVYATMNDLADTCDAHGQYAEAAALQARMLAHHRRVLGPDHPDTLLALSNLGNTYHRQRKFTAALDLQSRALEGRKRVLGPDHPATLNTMNNLASTLDELGRLAEAGELKAQTLEISRRVLGPNHPQTIAAMLNLGVHQYASTHFAEAEALDRSALAAAERTLGPDHPYTITALNNLANACAAQDKMAEATALRERSRVLVLRVFGPQHPNALLSNLGLATSYVKLQRFTEAVTLLEPTIDAMVPVFGADHRYRTSALIQLAAAREGLHQPAEAIALRRQVLASQQRSLGAEHADTMATAAKLATALLAQKDYAGAETIWRDVVRFGDRTAPDDWTTFSSRSALGGALAGLKRFAEAEPLLVSGYEGLRARESKIPSASRLRVTEALERLTRFYEDSGQPEKAAAWRKPDAP